MNIITSSNNAMIKEVKSLKSRKYRDEKGLFFIEGLKFVREALKEKAEITRIFVSEELADCPGGKTLIEQIKKTGISAIEPPGINILPAKLFNEISDTGTPQGILAVIKMENHELKREIEKDGLYVLLESIQDPGNMGTIIRTADAAGFSGVIIFKGCVDVYNPKVLLLLVLSILP
jgi:TrmH family RNA methyltransferase